MEMSLTAILLVCGVALLSSFIHGLVGMGYGIFAMGITALFLPYASTAAIVSVQLLLLTAQMAFTFRQHIDWKIVLIPCTVMCLGKVLGVVILMNVSGNLMKFFLGGMLLLLSVNGLYIKNEKLMIKGSKAEAVAFPLVGGLFGGLFNVAGPATALFFQAACKGDTRKYSASMNFSFVPSAAIGVAMHAFYGNFNIPVLQAGVLSLAGVAIGACLGVRIFVKIDAERFTKITFAFIGLVGILICIT